MTTEQQQPARSVESAKQFAGRLGHVSRLAIEAVEERDAQIRAAERAPLESAAAVIEQAQTFVDTVNALGGLTSLRTQDLVPMFNELAKRLATHRTATGENP